MSTKSPRPSPHAWGWTDAGRRLARKLQRYTVNIPKSQHAELLRSGILLSMHADGFFLLSSDIHYSLKRGLHPDITVPHPIQLFES